MRSFTLLSLAVLAGCTGVIGANSNPNGGAQCGARTAVVSPGLRRMTPLQYQRAIGDIFEGKVAPSSRYPGPNGKSETGFSTEPDLNAVSAKAVESLLYAAEDVAEALAPNLAALLPCASDANAGDACASAFLDKYGRRAYRRALTQDERAALLAELHGGLQSGASFTEAMAIMVDRMVQSPQFLYLVESAATTQRQLSPSEIASRLSFTLTDTIPDDELLAAAENHGLDTKDDVARHAKRLLASNKADTTIARMFREWTGTRTVSPADKLQSAFPTFDQKHADSMNESFDRFAVDVVKSGGTLRSMLRSSDAWVDANMAEIFNVSKPASGWTKVTLDPSTHTGILTQPALLASLAHSADTSYVFRGKFIQKQLLCTTLGTPPADAQAQFQMIMLPPNPTAKDVSATVQQRNPCGGCHSLIDPGGLALEQFDAIGRFRTTYTTGKLIDTSGTLRNVGLTFQGPVDMMEQITASPAVTTCFARQVFRFGLSRMDTPEDACAVKTMEGALQASGGRIDDALVTLVTSDAFLTRVDP